MARTAVPTRPVRNPFADDDQPSRRRRTLLVLGGVVAAALATAGLFVLTRGHQDPKPRTIVAVDATIRLDQSQRQALLERRVVDRFATRGEAVAIYRFGADGTEATERLAFVGRAPCEGPSCAGMWNADAQRVVKVAAAIDEDEPTGSGIAEALCSLPAKPGDTVLLLSDLAQRTGNLDLTKPKLTPGQVEPALDRARAAGLVCKALRGVHLEVLGFGSDGRTGAEADALQTFWTDLAHEAGVASITVQRFGA